MNKPKLLKLIKELLEADYPYAQARMIGEAKKIAKRIRKVLDKECRSPAQAKLRDSKLRHESECLATVLDICDQKIKKERDVGENNMDENNMDENNMDENNMDENNMDENNRDENNMDEKIDAGVEFVEMLPEIKWTGSSGEWKISSGDVVWNAKYTAE